MRRTTIVALCLAALATPALAKPGPMPPPLADARVVRPKKPAQPPPKPAPVEEGSEPCLGITAPAAPGTPFQPGEELTYALTVGGVGVGKLEFKAGRPRMVEGQRAESFFSRARTSGVVATLKPFEGRVMSVVEATQYLPLEIRSESTYGEDPRNEIARFSRDHRGVTAAYRQDKKNGERSYARERPVYDMITVLYHSRRLDLKKGQKFCQEVYGDKRLWRVDVEVMDVQSVRTPVGVKNARKVKTIWQRMPHPDFDPKKEAPRMEIDMFYGTDASRVPLAFEARTKEVTSRGELVRWATAD